MNLRRLIAGPLLSIVFLAFFAYAILNIDKLFSIYKIDFPVITASASLSLDSALEKIKFEPIETSALSAISVQTKLESFTEVLFEKNIDLVLPIASLTKLMTAIVILDNYKPSEIITISALADLQSPIKQDVFYGQRISSQDLLKLMIIGSSNKAAYALAEKYGINNFIEAMNAKVKAIGLKNTFFDDVTGIGSKNVSTAKDISILAEYILKNYPQIAQISSEKEIVISMLGKIYNTDALLKEVPDAVCSKTGFTTDAKGCLLLVINGQSSGEYIINVVLGADDRFFEMKKLINAYKACN